MDLSERYRDVFLRHAADDHDHHSAERPPRRTTGTPGALRWIHDGRLRTHASAEAPGDDTTGEDAVFGSSIYGTHFSPADFGFATQFNPPIAMYVGVYDTNTNGSNLYATRIYELNYVQDGVNSDGTPKYKVTGETPKSDRTSNTIQASKC